MAEIIVTSLFGDNKGGCCYEIMHDVGRGWQLSGCDWEFSGWDDSEAGVESTGGSKNMSLFDFMEKIIARLRQNGKIRTSETYLASLNSFRKYRKGEDIQLRDINAEVMEGYASWLERRGVVANTISFYARILRAVYNRAVEEGITENRLPFRHVYTGLDKTVKRALPIEMIRKIRALDLKDTPALNFARDMFMMSFMLRGMSFIDMAYLK